MTFTDLNKDDPSVWTIDFKFDGVYDTPILLTPGQTPLIITKGEDTDDKMYSILGSEATITAVITQESEEAIKADFYTTENFSIQCLITQSKNGSDVWSWYGFCKADFGAYNLSPRPYEFSISATDGIGLLSTINADLLDVSRSDTGYVEIIHLLMDLGLFKATNNELGVLRVVSSLHRSGKTATFDSVSLFYTLFVDDDGSFKDVNTVLKQIGASFGGRVFLDDIYYYFQRIADLSTDGLDSCLQYTDPDTAPNSISLGFVQTLGGKEDNADMLYVQDWAQVTISSAYKKISSDLDYLFINLLKNWDWSKMTSGQFDDWTASNWSLISRGGTGTQDDPYYCKFDAASGTEYLYQFVEFNFNQSVTISCKIDMSLCDRAAWQLHAFYDTQNWSSGREAYKNGTWSDADSLTPPGDSAWNNMISKPSGNNGVLDFSVTVPGPPAVESGGTFVGWYNNILLMFIDPDGGTTPSMKIYDVHFSFVPNGYTGEVMNASTSKKWSEEKDVDDLTLVDGNLYIANSLYYDGDDQSSNQWSADDFTGNIGSFKYGSMLSIMGQNSTPYEIMKGTFFSNSLTFRHVIKRLLDSKLFIQMYDQYDVKNCLHSMTLAEIKSVQSALADFDITRTFKSNGNTVTRVI